MTTNAKTNKTDATVPAQGEKEKPVVTLVEGEEQTETTSRLERVKDLLKKNQKAFVAAGLAAATAAVILAKYKTSQKAFLDAVTPDDEDESSAA